MKKLNLVSVLLVCMGNICRSPTAEGVLRAKVAQAGLQTRVRIDSAGTHNYHPGSPPDERSQEHALSRGYDISHLRARQVSESDYALFDLIVAMDWDNLALLQQDCPPQYAHKLRLFMSFADPALALGEVIPDPYHGREADFEDVLDKLEAASNGLVARLKAQLTDIS
jgi:protein-tyrosine phosphatase